MQRRALVGCSLLAVSLLGACTSYNVAHSVKLVSFVPQPSRSPSGVLMHGQDCRFSLVGVDLGPFPSADMAVLSSLEGSRSSLRLPTEIIGKSPEPEKAELRYINNFSVNENEFSVYLFGRDCIVAGGTGRK